MIDLFEITFAWLLDNLEWLFSGLGVIVISAVGKLLFIKKQSEKTLNQESIVSNQQVVNIYPNVATTPTNNSLDSLNYIDKAKYHILFIDDKKFDNVDILKQAGWINTKRMKDIKCIDCAEIRTANVIFVDINDVGSTLFPKEQGLGVAVKIKELYPEKYVVVYSAQPQPLHANFGKVDAVLPKDADPYQYISILENLALTL